MAHVLIRGTNVAKLHIEIRVIGGILECKSDGFACNLTVFEDIAYSTVIPTVSEDTAYLNVSGWFSKIVHAYEYGLLICGPNNS